MDSQLPDELAQHPESTKDELDEFTHWFGVECEVDAIDHEIKELHGATATTPLEIMERKRALAELTAQRGRLRAGVEGVSTPLPEPRRPEAAEPLEPSAPAILPPKRKRADLLTPVIDRAQAQANDPTDHSEVFATLRAWATSDNKPTPIIGYADGEGVQWQDGSDKVRWLNLAALRKRINRPPVAAKGR